MRTLKLGENMLTCQKSKTLSRTQTFWFQIFCSNAPKCTWYLAPQNNTEKRKLIVNRPCHLWSQTNWQAKLDEPLRTTYSTFLFHSRRTEWGGAQSIKQYLLTLCCTQGQGEEKPGQSQSSRYCWLTTEKPFPTSFSFATFPYRSYANQKLNAPGSLEGRDTMWPPSWIAVCKGRSTGDTLSL